MILGASGPDHDPARDPDFYRPIDVTPDPDRADEPQHVPAILRTSHPTPSHPEAPPMPAFEPATVESIKSNALARLEAPTPDGGQAVYGAPYIPGLAVLNSTMISFVVDQILAKADESLDEYRDEIELFVAQKAGEAAKLLLNGADGLIDQLRARLVK